MGARGRSADAQRRGQTAMLTAGGAAVQFWELDQDHDFMIDRDDLLRYGGHGLTYRIVDRIFQQVPRRFSCPTPGKMGYEDFVYFILSEEDKTTDVSLRYWHRCVDLDDDGIITREDMRCAAPVL